MNKTIELAIEVSASYMCALYALPWDICWGSVREMGQFVFENAVGFILSPDYACEEIIPVC